MKKSKFSLVMIRQMLITALILSSMSLSAKKGSREPVLLYNYEDKISSQKFSYAFMSNQQPDYNSKPLVVQPTLTVPTCVKTHYEGRLYYILKAGDTYEFGSDKGSNELNYIFNIEVTVKRVNENNQIIEPPYTKTLTIKNRNIPGNDQVIPEDLAFNDIDFYYMDGPDQKLIKKLVITDVNFLLDDFQPPAKPQAIQNLKDSIHLELFYTLNQRVDVKNTGNPGEAIICVDYFEQPSDGPGFRRFTYYFNAEGLQNHMQPIRLQWFLINNGCNDITQLKIPNYHVQLLKLESINSDQREDARIDAIIDWNKALNLYSGDSLHLDVILTQGTGHYIWRVRPVGNYYPGGLSNIRNYGVWNKFSSVAGYAGSYHVPIPPTNTGYDNGINMLDLDYFMSIHYYEKNWNSNWIYKRSITSADNNASLLHDGVTFYDDILKPRQTQVKIDSSDVSLVVESYYDHVGRNTLNTITLPTMDNIIHFNEGKRPRRITGLSYKKDLMKKNTKKFELADYDNGSLNISDIDGGKFHDYYNGDDNLGLNMTLVHSLPIPSAEGYPFSRSLFFDDGTDRVKEVGGVGATLNKFTGTDKTSISTRYYLTSDDELLPLFGDETPSYKVVTKAITTDQNHIETINYIDNSIGKTIATALNPVSDAFTRLNTITSTHDNIFQRVVYYKINGREYFSEGKYYYTSKDIYIPNNSTQVTINYYNLFEPIEINDFCGQLGIPPFCKSIGVNAEVYFWRKDNPGTNLITDNVRSRILEDCPTLHSLSKYWVGSCNKGEYVAARKLFIHYDEFKQALINYLTPAIDNYLNGLFDPAINNLKNIIVNDGELDDFYTFLVSQGWEVPLQGTNFYTNNDQCNSIIDLLKIPKVLCKEPCKFNVNLGLDPNNARIYNYNPTTNEEEYSYEYYLWKEAGDLISQCEDISSPPNKLNKDKLNSYFYRNYNYAGSTEKLYTLLPPSYPNVDGNGAFNILVMHMSNDGWDNEKLCDCWRNSVKLLKSIGIKHDPTTGIYSINTDFDLLETFLTCAGTQYIGISNHSWATGLTGPQTIQRNAADNAWVSDYGYGYLEYAHKYFFYDPKIRIADKSERDYLNGNKFLNTVPNPDEINTDPAGFGSNSTLWTNFYKAQKNERTTQQAKDNLKEKHEEFDNDENYGNDRTVKFDDALIDCFNMSNNEITWSCIEAIVKSKIDVCENGCEKRDFETKVKEMLRNNDILIVDETEHNCQVGGIEYITWRDDNNDGIKEPYDETNTMITDHLIATQDDIQLYVTVLVAHCKSECHLSITVNESTTPDGSQSIQIGTEAERIAYNHATKDDYKIELPGCLGRSRLQLGCYDSCTDCSIYEVKLGCGVFEDEETYYPTRKAYFQYLTYYLNNALNNRIEEIKGYFSGISGYRYAYEYARNPQTGIGIRQDNCDYIRDAFDGFSLWSGDGGYFTGLFDAAYSTSMSNASYFHPCSTSIYCLAQYNDGGMPLQIPQSDPTLNSFVDYSYIRYTYKNPPYCHQNNNCSSNNGARNDEWILFPSNTWYKVRTYNNPSYWIWNDWRINFLDRFVIYHKPDVNEDYLLYARWWIEHEERALLPAQYEAPYQIFPDPLITGSLQKEYKFLCEPLNDHLQGYPERSLLCFRWIDTDYEYLEPEITNKLSNCTSKNGPMLLSLLEENKDIAKERIMSKALDQFESKYKELVEESFETHEQYTVKFSFGLQHFTLYYYDRAGNLVKTVPPKGVEYVSNRKRKTEGGIPASTNHDFETVNKYNSLGNIIAFRSPDESAGGTPGPNDENRFYYDSFNRLRFSQSPAQRALNLITYIKYDNLNRIVETGEALAQPDPVLKDFAKQIGNNYPDINDQKTSYSEFVYSIRVTLPQPYDNETQHNLRNRLSYAKRYNARERGLPQPPEPYLRAEVTTYYSYDIHGNVEWIIQKVPHITDNFHGSFLGGYVDYIVSKIGYEYDVLSGRVKKMIYNDKRDDQFYQRFEYDRDDNLANAYSSRNSEIWDRDARYVAYLHGPLQKTEIGEDGLLVNNFYYTPQGWLKAMNSSSLSGEAGTVSATSRGVKTAPSQFGYILNYFRNDFVHNNFATLDKNKRLFKEAGSDLYSDLYNGNISSVEYSYSDIIKGLINDEPTGTGINQYGNIFRYDLLNRLNNSFMLWNNGVSTTWQPATNDNKFASTYQYDGNGNIVRLTRSGSTGQIHDDINYNYNYMSGGGARPYKNRLQAITGMMDGNPVPTTKNYTYDNGGNLQSEIQGNNIKDLQNIKWTFDGKLHTATKTVTVGPGECCPEVEDDYTEIIRYLYDAQGNRVADVNEINGLHQRIHEFNCENAAECYVLKGVKGTYYIRDAKGIIIAIYEDKPKIMPFPEPAEPYFFVVLKEWNVYGNTADGRIASVLPDIKDADGYLKYDPIINTAIPSDYPRRIGYKLYELKDHLGDVRVVLNDIKEPNSTNILKSNYTYKLNILNVNTFYPFGLPITGMSFEAPANDYSFGYNGMLQDDALKGKGRSYSTQFREYDPYIGRWWSLDPKPTASESWYVGMGDNPIQFMDPLGDIIRNPDGSEMKDEDLFPWTLKSWLKLIGDGIDGTADAIYKGYQILTPKYYIGLDGKIHVTSRNHIYDIKGKPVTKQDAIRDVFREAALQFLPLTKVGGIVTRAEIGGVARELESISIVGKHDKHLINKSWSKEIVKSTSNGGKALFKPDIDVPTLDFNVITQGKHVPGTDIFIMKSDRIVGATQGVETQYVKTYYNSIGEIHSVPITESEFQRHLKKVNEFECKNGGN